MTKRLLLPQVGQLAVGSELREQPREIRDGEIGHLVGRIVIQKVAVDRHRALGIGEVLGRNDRRVLPHPTCAISIEDRLRTREHARDRDLVVAVLERHAHQLVERPPGRRSPRRRPRAMGLVRERGDPAPYAHIEQRLAHADGERAILHVRDRSLGGIPLLEQALFDTRCGRVIEQPLCFVDDQAPQIVPPRHRLEQIGERQKAFAPHAETLTDAPPRFGPLLGASELLLVDARDLIRSRRACSGSAISARRSRV